MNDRLFNSTTLATAGVAAISLASVVSAGNLQVPSVSYPTIEIALNNAVDGDVIMLSPGTYFETVDLGGLDVTLVGTGGPDVTTINAFGLGSVITMNGGQTLNGTVIEGLTITGGVAARGGGINITNASATIRNCKIVGNECLGVGGDGGGLFIETGSVVVEETLFQNNDAADVGGGAYFRTGTNVTLTRCHFEGNNASKGGGIANNGTVVTMVDSTFLLNGTQADTEDGGALWAYNSTLTIDRCHFEASSVYDDGSVLMAENSSDVEFTNCVFLNNVSDSNATIYSWQAGTSVDVHHCTMYGNIAADTSTLRAFEGGVMTFRNGIIWGNTGSSAISGSVTASFGAIQDGYGGTNILTVDPMLDAGLRLLPASPAIDAADTFVLVGNDPRDFDANPRAVDDPDAADAGVPVYGLTADMGAFEYQPGAPAPTCSADTNGDSMINVTDLLTLLAAWGACP